MVRTICLHTKLSRTAGVGEIDIFTYIDEMTDYESVYEFCEKRGAAGTSGPAWGGCNVSLSETLDMADHELFPTVNRDGSEVEQTFWVHLCNPMHLDKAHRSFWITGTPERVIQLIQRELHEWACMVQKERMLLKERVLA